MTNEISQYRISPAHQRGACLNQAISHNRSSCNCTDGVLRCIRTAGISIYPTSAESNRYDTYSGAQRGLYSQAPQKLSLSSERFCKIQWQITQFFSYPSSGNISQNTRPWLEVNIRYGCFTALIGWLVEKFLKPIGFWFRIKYVLKVKQTV